MITCEQCRAARGLLGWTQQDLANAANLSKTAINNYERGLSDIKEDSLRSIRNAFYSAQVEFIGSSGVQKMSDTVTVLKGGDSYFQLLDDIYDSLKKEGGELLICNISRAFREKMISVNSKKMHDHQKRIEKAGISQRFLTEREEALPLASPETYRWLDPESFSSGKMSFIYAKKMALKLWYNDMILIINSPQASETERERFEILWERSESSV